MRSVRAYNKSVTHLKAGMWKHHDPGPVSLNRWYFIASPIASPSLSRHFAVAMAAVPVAVVVVVFAECWEKEKSVRKDKFNGGTVHTYT